METTFRTWVCGALMLGLAGLSACEGCKGSGPAGPKVPEAETPTVRLFLTSDGAGALEPCGCVKDQLGGLDHLGALVRKEQTPNAAFASAGPLFFMDPELKADKASQDRAKAETIAQVLRGFNLAAFAPGKNEWAGGAELLGKVTQQSGGAMLFGNAPSGTATHIRELGGLKVGFIGVSNAESPLGAVKSPEDTVKAGVAELRAKGAKVFIALAATGRGAAKRIADVAPELTAVVVGSPGGQGDVNTSAPPVEMVGNVLLIETGNHFQNVAVLDLFVRGDAYTFADGAGLDRNRKREELAKRIDELRVKLAVWEKDPLVQKSDIEARRGDVAKLEAERAELDKAPPPKTGSYFRYRLEDVRDNLGADERVKAQMTELYKRVNEENRQAFQGRKPKPVAAGEPSYVGIETCSTCHEDARAVWDKTAHAGAYKTLSSQFKEFNLDCVSCHVTGYERPGGSTVTFVDALKNVQCETCHGPGSLHVKSAGKTAIPAAKPKADLCESCHHPPHVHSFDANTKMSLVLGPGHGRPKN
jgi:hypothetical protein